MAVMRVTGCISGVMLAVLVGGACGGTAWKDATPAKPSPADGSVLVTAAQQTAAEQSAHVELDANVTSMGQSGGARVEGDVDFESRNADLHVTTTGAAGSSAGSFELRLADGVLYLRLPESARAQASVTKPWVKLDATQLGSLGGALTPGNLTSPQDILSTLQSLPGGVTNLGTEQRGGVTTTHYHATIDVDALLKEYAGPAAQVALGILSAIGGDKLSFPVDVWVDRAGRVRELDIVANTSMIDASVRLRLSNFGESVHVDAPPADQVGTLPLGGSIGSPTP